MDTILKQQIAKIVYSLVGWRPYNDWLHVHSGCITFIMKDVVTITHALPAGGYPLAVKTATIQAPPADEYDWMGQVMSDVL